MEWNRIRHTIGMCLKRTGQGRGEYLHKHDIFRHAGKNCMVMFRKIPLHPELISMGDNVWIASGVSLTTHDVINRMLNNRAGKNEFPEHLGCIEIGDNVFIGEGTTVLPGVTIGSDVVVAAMSLVNKDLASGGVYGGVPARYICSLEELIEKRRNAPAVKITRISSGESDKFPERKDLSGETAEALWELHRKRRKETK
ncbi:MAG: acyltransferase [Lachnospiraceae bacterium]|nr:acyltransferase [Lachnospiraceae bacterium]